MGYKIASYTHPGKREQNEDRFGIYPGPYGLLILAADGLGGHEGGEDAASLAVQTISSLLADMVPGEEALKRAIDVANRDIQALGGPMRTTLAALWIGEDRFLVGHVGDSRVYHFRDGALLQRTMDHSVAQMAVLVGEMHPDQLRSSPERNHLLRVLGDPDGAQPEVEVFDALPGDRFLVCTDGFWEPVTESIMVDTMNQSQDPESWLLLMRAYLHLQDLPHQDNNTAVCLML